MRRFVCLLGLVLSLASVRARAQSETDTFGQAAALLQKGAFSEALLHFERLSDRGFVHPDVSFDRALAYLKRADSAQAQPGDLGQAVAGLREAATLGADEEAERLVETVRQAISRRRAARGRDPVVVSPPLARAVSDLVRPSTWASLALFASFVLTTALVLRSSTKPALRLAANVGAAASLLLLAVFGAMFALSDHYRRAWQEAVVIVDHATLRDAQGRPLLTRALDTNSDEIPEGASVYVVSRSARLFEVQWGSSKAWLRDGELRILAKP